ncbi:MAG TPA: crotonase/enoyl-CoA hydratase family protein [Puia sp.]|nr:crotonase/enoyl-CoA hydratase family protein [Puia sp.]
MSNENGNDIQSGTSSVQLKTEGEILLVKISREKKSNALNDETMLAIEKIFSSVPAGIKCAIIYGAGKHFSSGLDLSEFMETDTIEGVHHSRMWHRVLDKIQFGTVPVIAVLHGACVGGGLELASACHIRVAETSAFYALPEGQRGIFVGGSASVRLPKLIGMARVADMMFTGRVIDAKEGNSIGISQYIAEEGKGLEKARELAAKITGNAALTNYALMHILPRIVDASQEGALMMESLIAAISRETPEAKQRMKEFLDGRAKKIRE